jgi:hypothetical protein
MRFAKTAYSSGKLFSIDWRFRRALLAGIANQ